MAARIDALEPVFTLINTFIVMPEHQDAVVASLRCFTEDHTRYLPGFVATAVHASLDGQRVVNYVQWQSVDAMKAMLATEAARAHLAEVSAIAERIDPVPYQVAYVSSGA